MYVYDVLHLHHDPDTFVNRLAEVYRLKDSSVGEPNRYLRDEIEKVHMDDSSVSWSMTSREYVTNAIRNLEDTLACDGTQPLKILGKKSGGRPFPSNYRPELDVPPKHNSIFYHRF